MHNNPASNRLSRQPMTTPEGGPVKSCPWVLAYAFLALACTQPTELPVVPEWRCALSSHSDTAYASTIGCLDDYAALAARPFDNSLPGSWSVKTILDQADGNRLYLLNTRKYRIHWEFASERLSGNGKPLVSSMSKFGTEYYTPGRRFILGTLARYERPGIWTFELTPSDNASAEMIALAYAKLAEACFCGKDLYFHATSQAIEAEAAKLPASIKVITTPQMYQDVAYQPLHFGTSIGRLVFPSADKLKLENVGPRDIVVLEAAPDTLPIVSGLITRQFQTPLSHLNVSAQDRGVPNMGLRGALTDSTLRALEGKWVKLTVATTGYSVTEVTQAEADAWWNAYEPVPVVLSPMDTSMIGLVDLEDILDWNTSGPRAALEKAIPAFGGKTTHFAALPHLDTSKVRYEKSFGIPISYYWQHLQRHGLHDTLARILADPQFKADPAERAHRLQSFRKAIEEAPLDSAFWNLLTAKLDATFPGRETIHFRSSTNAEALDHFTGVGLYESKIGNRSAVGSLRKALLEVWSSVWDPRAFAERDHRRIDHRSVGMALLVQAPQDEVKANGVAISSNPFDPPGYEPGFYINVQAGSGPVSHPDPSITSEQFVFHWWVTGQPIVQMALSNQVPVGTSVLTPAQTHALGAALREIQIFFLPLYGEDLSHWFGMHTEFKLVPRPGAEPAIILTQARPYRGWGTP